MSLPEFDKLFLVLEKRYNHEPYHRGREKNNRVGGDIRVAFGQSKGYQRKHQNIIGDVHKQTGTSEEIAIEQLRDAPGFKPVDVKMFSHLRSVYNIDPQKLDTEEKQIGRTGANGYSVFLKKEIANNKPVFTLYSKKVVL